MRKIAIEKWVDPFKADEKCKWPDFTDEPEETEGILHYGEHDLLIDSLRQLEEEEAIEENESRIKVIQTPMGVMPLTEDSFASRVFNFWVIHTNFPVSSDMIDEIAHIDGVEELMPITKHRFRIAVGRLFTPAEVYMEIKELLCSPTCDEVDEMLTKEVSDLKEKISTNYEYWGIYVVPNGKMVHTCSQEEDDDFIKEIGEYTSIHEKVGGILWTYKDEMPLVT